MAYRRKQGITRSSTFKEETYRPPPSSDHHNAANIPIAIGGGPSSSSSSPSPSSSLAAQAIRASAAHRDSSLSSAYGDSAFHSFFNDHNHHPSSSKFYQPPESARRIENPRLRKGLDAITSSFNHIGGTIGNAFEEGCTMVESKTADIIHETRKLQIRRKGANVEELNNTWQHQSTQSTQGQMLPIQEDRLKASRDVAMATAAKAKLLLRELKTVKADLAFAKERSSQLEEENRKLREGREKKDNPADDDMIRLQLETLLAEKARLAHENSVYARENRFLREIVEYHQLTMQDVVYLDEGAEEVSEVYPDPAYSRMLSASPPPSSPPSEISPEDIADGRESEAPTSFSDSERAIEISTRY